MLRRVVVTQRNFDDAASAFLHRNGCEVVLAELPPGEADANLTHAELVAMLDGAAGWIVGHARVSRDLMAALPELHVISRRGVGFDKVDLGAAFELGRVVAIAGGRTRRGDPDRAALQVRRAVHLVGDGAAGSGSSCRPFP